MMRSLWTGASGMTAQQMQIDVISNNLANVNTYGFKRERVEFSTLLYQTMTRAELDAANPPGRPVNLQVGLGVRPAATSRDFNVGSFERTDQQLDFAISGRGFFNVRLSNIDDPVEVIAFTRDGSFQAMPVAVGSAELILVNNAGMPILGVDGEPIIFEEWVVTSQLDVSGDGLIRHPDPEDANAEAVILGQIAMSQFPNTQGLEGIGGNLFLQTSASGAPMLERAAVGGPSEVTRPSQLVQGVLEMANVNVAVEMVHLITTQRAYELNARAISTSDQMLQEAVNLRR